MQKWKYSMVSFGVNPAYPSRIWTENKKDGTTSFDMIKERGNEGWELVGVTPLAQDDGATSALLFTFKKPEE